MAEVGVRDRIVDAALGEFTARGYDAASVREIAERARVTKPMLYYYFASKQGLFDALFDASLADLSSALVHAASTKGSGFDKLLTVALAYCGPALKRPLDFVLATQQARPDGAAALLRLHRRVTDGILEAACANAEMRDVDREVFALTFFCGLAPLKGRPSPIITAYVDLLWHGLSP